MDSIEALLNLEDRISKLRNSREISFSGLGNLGQMVAIAAKAPDGYKGLAWQYGGDLLDLARNAHFDEQSLFDSFGWLSLTNGIEGALKNREILKALCFAEYESFWQARSLASSNTTVGPTLANALKAIPHAFVDPSLLATASDKVQKQFVSLFGLLVTQPIDPELKLQWGACALRALPVTCADRFYAAMGFIDTLHSINVPATTFCVFRALAEQHEELWISDCAIKVLQQYIELLIDDPEQGVKELVSLCTDDDLLYRCDSEQNLLVMLGAVGIYLVVHKDSISAGERIAWRFVNGIQNEFPLLAHAFYEFFANAALPPWPEKLAVQLDVKRSNLLGEIDNIKTLLRDRGYDGVSLARQIYQWNIKHKFSPLLEKIENCPPDQLARLRDEIESLDAKQLVLDNPNQKESRYPIEGRLLHKMTNDNDKILEALHATCTAREELVALRVELTNRSAESFRVFMEFEKFTGFVAIESQRLFERLLPDIWYHLRKGLEISKEEAGLLHETW